MEAINRLANKFKGENIDIISSEIVFLEFFSAFYRMIKKEFYSKLRLTFLFFQYDDSSDSPYGYYRHENQSITINLYSKKRSNILETLGHEICEALFMQLFRKEATQQYYWALKFRNFGESNHHHPKFKQLEKQMIELCLSFGYQYLEDQK